MKGNANLMARIDDLALTTTWSRRALEMWCMTARSYARRRRLSLSDDITAEMLQMAVEVATATNAQAGSPEEFMALLSPSSVSERMSSGDEPSVGHE